MKYLGDNMWVDAEGHSGHAYEWNGSKTVKVFAGGKQVDVITFMEQPTRAQVEGTINRRIREGHES